MRAGCHVGNPASSMARISDDLVLIGYVIFIGFAIAKMQRLVHDFGWIRALLSTVIGIALLSTMVSYVQEPIISQLICSYVSPP